MALGIAESFSWKENMLSIVTPLESEHDAALIIAGGLRIRETGEELGRFLLT